VSESEFPGWEADDFGSLTLSVTVLGQVIRLATVTRDAETGLYETYIGYQVSSAQLGRHDSSQERAIRKVEDFLVPRLQNLL
jgi:hypothetical protein